MYAALQCWGGSECGSHSYAGNVSLCSARTGLEKPTTLFKEMAVRGPSAALISLSFPPAQSHISFLIQLFSFVEERIMCIPVGEAAAHIYTYEQVYVQTTHYCNGGVVGVIISGTFVNLIGMHLCKVL